MLAFTAVLAAALMLLVGDMLVVATMCAVHAATTLYAAHVTRSRDMVLFTNLLAGLLALSILLMGYGMLAPAVYAGVGLMDLLAVTSRISYRRRAQRRRAFY